MAKETVHKGKGDHFIKIFKEILPGATESTPADLTDIVKIEIYFAPKDATGAYYNSIDHSDAIAIIDVTGGKVQFHLGRAPGISLGRDKKVEVFVYDVLHVDGYFWDYMDVEIIEVL